MRQLACCSLLLATMFAGLSGHTTSARSRKGVLKGAAAKRAAAPTPQTKDARQSAGELDVQWGVVEKPLRALFGQLPPGASDALVSRPSTLAALAEVRSHLPSSTEPHRPANEQKLMEGLMGVMATAIAAHELTVWLPPSAPASA